MSTSATVVREATGRIVGLSWHRFPPAMSNGSNGVRPLFGPNARQDAPPAEPREFVLPPAKPSNTAQIEREAFERGYADGQRDATAAAAERYDAAVERLVTAARELQALRTGFLRRSEDDVFNLAMAIAEKVIGQAIAVDRSLFVGMARQALERLAEPMLATIQMRPEDLDAIPEAERAALSNGPLRLEAAPNLPPGGCIVQTPRGTIDLTPRAQLKEILEALVPDDHRD